MGIPPSGVSSSGWRASRTRRRSCGDRWGPQRAGLLGQAQGAYPIGITGVDLAMAAEHQGPRTGCVVAPGWRRSGQTGTGSSLTAQARLWSCASLTVAVPGLLQDLELLVYLDGFTEHSGGSHVATTSDMGGDAAEQGAGTSAGWRALVALANRAAVVVTEEMPVSPEAQWLKVGLSARQAPKGIAS